MQRVKTFSYRKIDELGLGLGLPTINGLVSANPVVLDAANELDNWWGGPAYICWWMATYHDRLL